MILATRAVSQWVAASRGAWVVIAVVAACSTRPSGESDTATPGSSAAPAAAAVRSDSPVAKEGALSPRATPADCVSEGNWQPCSIEKRLTDAGFVPIRKGAAPSGLFPVVGTAYTLGAAELEVYVFASAKAREQAVAAIDTATVSRRGGAPQAWAVPPTFIASNNLAAILLSDNARQIERVQNAIKAGLPAASR